VQSDSKGSRWLKLPCDAFADQTGIQAQDQQPHYNLSTPRQQCILVMKAVKPSYIYIYCYPSQLSMFDLTVCDSPALVQRFRVSPRASAAASDSTNIPYHCHAVLLAPTRRASVVEYPQKIAAFTSHARASVAPAWHSISVTQRRRIGFAGLQQPSSEMIVNATCKGASTFVTYVNMVCLPGQCATVARSHPNPQEKGGRGEGDNQAVPSSESRRPQHSSCL
jgi:hypothetical protein